MMKNPFHEREAFAREHGSLFRLTGMTRISIADSREKRKCGSKKRTLPDTEKARTAVKQSG